MGGHVIADGHPRYLGCLCPRKANCTATLRPHALLMMPTSFQAHPRNASRCQMWTNVDGQYKATLGIHTYYWASMILITWTSANTGGNPRVWVVDWNGCPYRLRFGSPRNIVGRPCNSRGSPYKAVLEAHAYRVGYHSEVDWMSTYIAWTTTLTHCGCPSRLQPHTMDGNVHVVEAHVHWMETHDYALDGHAIRVVSQATYMDSHTYWMDAHVITRGCPTQRMYAHATHVYVQCRADWIPTHRQLGNQNSRFGHPRQLATSLRWTAKVRLTHSK